MCDMPEMLRRRQDAQQRVVADRRADRQIRAVADESAGADPIDAMLDVATIEPPAADRRAVGKEAALADFGEVGRQLADHRQLGVLADFRAEQPQPRRQIDRCVDRVHHCVRQSGTPSRPSIAAGNTSSRPSARPASRGT